MGCGKCENCRINRKRQWAGRIMLEMLGEGRMNVPSVFVTLTYAPENVPLLGTLADDGSYDVDQTLNPDDVQRFLKRLRKALQPRRIRFFAVGEYGDESGRPHYHLCLFNVSVDDEVVILDRWGLGHVKVDEMHVNRALYCASYCVKKMTKKDDERLGARVPEFARMSRNPALGTPGVDYLARLHMSRDGSKVLAENGDIIREFRLEGKRFPMAYTIAQKVREELGVPDRACMRPRRDELVELTPEDVEEGRAAVAKAIKERIRRNSGITPVHFRV